MSIQGKLVDDFNLLETIISDWENSPTVKEVQGEMIHLYSKFIDDLKKYTFEQNIANKIRGLTAVNGVDNNPIRYPIAKLERRGDFDLNLKESIRNTLEFVCKYREQNVLPYDLSLRDLDESAFRLCEFYGKACGAPDIRNIEISKANNPEYTFFIDGKEYSYILLTSYIHYCYCAQFIKFDEIDNIIEIGGGVGRQLEITKKFHPHLNFYMVDLGPTLYACHQYMSAIFPDSVIPYQQTRDKQKITIDGKGKIAFVGNWQLDKLKPQGTTLSFNTAVFCIMQEETVARYISYLQNHCDIFYLMEPRTDETKKIYNLPSAPTYNTYEKLFNQNFTILNRQEAFRPLSARRDFGGFDMMMWISNKNTSSNFLTPLSQELIG